MDLAQCDQLVRRVAEASGRATSVLLHQRQLVAAAETAIERAERTFADAAAPRAEAVPDAVQCRQGRRLDDHVDQRSASVKPGGTGMAVLAMAITLNSSPICSVATSRSNPLASTASCSADAVRASFSSR